MYEITNSNKNKDWVFDIKSLNKEYYLDLYGSFKSKLPMPEFYSSPERDDIFILDFANASPSSVSLTGTKRAPIKSTRSSPIVEPPFAINVWDAAAFE